MQQSQNHRKTTPTAARSARASRRARARPWLIALLGLRIALVSSACDNPNSPDVGPDVEAAACVDDLSAQQLKEIGSLKPRTPWP